MKPFLIILSLYYILHSIIGWAALIVVTFGGFYLLDRKHKTWYYYAGLTGNALFIIWILFLIQHYPKDILSVIISLLMFAGIVGNIIALLQKKVEPSQSTTLRIILYALMFFAVFNNYVNGMGSIHVPAFIEHKLDSINK